MSAKLGKLSVISGETMIQKVRRPGDGGLSTAPTSAEAVKKGAGN